MPRRSSNKQVVDSTETLAADIAPAVQAAEPPTPLTADGKNAAAVALGRLGGRKGGKARAAKLTAAQRKSIAKRAAAARWVKKKTD